MIDANYRAALLEKGFIDEAGVAAETDGRTVLCVNGEVVSLVRGDPPQKVFSDTVDNITDIVVKRGLFGGRLFFTHRGDGYAFKIKGGKTLLEYFYMLANNFD